MRTFIGRLRHLLGLMDHSVAVVVFTVPEQGLAKMHVTTGPCVPIGGRRPLVGLSRLDGGEYPDMTAAMYTAITGQDADSAMILIRHEGQGRLYECSTSFLNAMADLKDEVERLHDEDADESYPDLQKLDQVDRAWVATGVWPRHMTSTSGRLSRLDVARLARDQQQPLYVWHGPNPASLTTVGVEL